MSDKPEAAAAGKAPGKSKLMLIIMAAVVVLLLGGGGAYFYISKQRAAAAAAEDGGEDPAPKAATKEAGKVTPPGYLPMDNMVVNLADPGGERVAQIGVTLVTEDAHQSEEVKGFLPTIRSGVLMLVAQRTSEELLKPEGKEKLKKDILREASIPFGGGNDEEDAPDTQKKKKKKAHVDYPVTDVLFSSFIVQ